MSLQVWLPLNGNLQNKGLADASVINNGATVNNSGKIGQCYSFDGTDDYLSLNNLTCAGWAEFSLTCWCYPTTDFGALFLIRGGGTHRVRITGSGFAFRDNNNSTLRSFVFNTEIPLNTWTHLACIYNRGKIFIYINGVLTNSNTTYYHDNSVFLSDHNEVRIARQTSTSGSAYYTGKINDFRIYNHALSQKEVKEISKALILHYPLDNNGLGFINSNLLKNSYGIIVDKTHNASGSRTEYYAWNVGSSYTDITTNTTVTISFDLEMYVNNITGYNGALLVYNTNNKGPVQIIGVSYVFKNYYSIGDTINERISLTTTLVPRSDANKTDNFIEFYTGYGTDNFYKISNVKIELGTQATPWCPNENDQLYNILGYDQNIIYDTSGYSQNGTLNGTFENSMDTPRYSASQKFTGTNYILTPENSFSWFSFDQCTISLWIKPTINPSSWTGSVGIAHNNSSTYKSFAISNYSGKFTVNSANGSWVNITSSDLPINEWHHCVATLNTGIIKMYLDGVLVKTYTMDWKNTTVASDTRVQIGIDLPGSDEVFTGYYSDIRIYTTELSEEDILQLYQTPTAIDRDQNIYIREIRE